MKLIRICSLVLFITFSFNFTLAQEKEEDLTHGINIYLFDGYAAGYRFNECSSSFWRVNLDLYSNYSDRTQNSDGYSITISNADTNSSESDDKHNSFSISLTPQYLFKLYQNKYIGIYSGGGILIGYNRDEYKTTYTYLGGYSNNNYHYTVSSGYSVGIIGVLGLEGKLTENFSVFVESQLSGIRYWSNSSTNNSSASDATEQQRGFASSKNKGWSANFVLSRVGIIIRF